MVRGMKSADYRGRFRERLGIPPREFKPRGILIHCASVGETLAARPFIDALVSEFVDLPVTVTTTSPTGSQQVRSLFGSKVQHCYLPIDWRGSCCRFLDRLQPQICILMETELWPNLLSVLKSKDIPVMLANARLSEKSHKKYQKWPKFSRNLFSKVSLIAAQYQSDKDNFAKNGANKVELVGNIKFDIEINECIRSKQQQLRAVWHNKRPVWIAASVHPGEFETILAVHQALLTHIPDLLLIAVPRHPEKFAEFKLSCEQNQLSYICRSDDIIPDKETQVIVGDSMGEMLIFLGAADVAFVGGSLIERGGHNPLEPLACGLPVVMGESFYNFSDIVNLLKKDLLLESVGSQQQLIETLSLLLSDSALREQKALRAVALMKNNQGCVSKLVKYTRALINQSPE